MSGALAAIGTGLTFATPAAMALGDLVPAWIRQGRKIGKIIPDVTIEENHSDRLQVTQHPVMVGSPISDHAFRMPASLTMRCGWSNANLAGTVVQSFTMGTSPWGGFTETRAREIYERLRELQGLPDTVMNEPQLVSITTGKRDYKNMALIEISVSTDHTKEYSLFVEAHFQEVILVRTKTTTQPSAAAQLAPEKTEQTQDQPGKQATPVTKSIWETLSPTPGGGFTRPLPVPPIPPVGP